MRSVRLLKYFLFFLALALTEAVAFPFIGKSHLDITDRLIQPYVVKGLVVLSGIAYVIILIARRPVPDTAAYAAGKIVFPVMITILVLNLAEFFPNSFNGTAVTIMVMKLSGIATAVWLWILFFRRRELN